MVVFLWYKGKVLGFVKRELIVTWFERVYLATDVVGRLYVIIDVL